jgi:hypothetical protein
MKERFIRRIVLDVAEVPYQKAVDRILNVFVPKDPNVWAVVTPLFLGREAYQTIYWMFLSDDNLEEDKMAIIDEWFVLDEDLADWNGEFSNTFYYAQEETKRGKYPPMILRDRTEEATRRR